MVRQLHELYHLRPDIRELLEASAGAATEVEIVSRRDLLCRSLKLSESLFRPQIVVIVRHRPARPFDFRERISWRRYHATTIREGLLACLT
jgi:hypothetical protein